MKCPACSRDLTEFKFGGVSVDACAGGCGGIWFDAFELQRVDEQREVPSEYLLRIQHDPMIVVDQSRKRDCPRCDDVKLKRHFFSAQKQVEVDHCPNCGGYWLDAGELEKIREEKAAQSKSAKAQEPGLSMEAIRYLYHQKLEQRQQL
jgi:Zn-finger nucleic acid-binding protein